MLNIGNGQRELLNAFNGQKASIWQVILVPALDRFVMESVESFELEILCLEKLNLC